MSTGQYVAQFALVGITVFILGAVLTWALLVGRYEPQRQAARAYIREHWPWIWRIIK